VVDLTHKTEKSFPGNLPDSNPLTSSLVFIRIRY